VRGCVLGFVCVRACAHVCECVGMCVSVCVWGGGGGTPSRGSESNRRCPRAQGLRRGRSGPGAGTPPGPEPPARRGRRRAARTVGSRSDPGPPLQTLAVRTGHVYRNLIGTGWSTLGLGPQMRTLITARHKRAAIPSLPHGPPQFIPFPANPVPSAMHQSYR